MFCKKCGGRLETYADNCAFCGQAVEKEYGVKYVKPYEEGKSKSVGGWFLVHLLLMVPILNFILIFVWAFGSKTKEDPTFRNWARLNAFLMIFITIIIVILSILMLTVLEDFYQSVAPF